MKWSEVNEVHDVLHWSVQNKRWKMKVWPKVPCKFQILHHISDHPPSKFVSISIIWCVECRAVEYFIACSPDCESKSGMMLHDEYSKSTVKSLSSKLDASHNLSNNDAKDRTILQPLSDCSSSKSKSKSKSAYQDVVLVSRMCHLNGITLHSRSGILLRRPELICK